MNFNPQFLLNMRSAKTILHLVGDIYMLECPNFFYQQVVYFPEAQRDMGLRPFTSLYEIFVDQVDIKLIEEQAEGSLNETQACFFFRS